MSVKHSKTATPDFSNLLSIKKLTFLLLAFPLFTYESPNKSPEVLPNGSYRNYVLLYISETDCELKCSVYISLK